MDIIMNLYNALMADPYINQHAAGRIKFYEYPATSSVTQPFIIIDPLSPPLDTDYADDDSLAEEYLYQVDVWTKDRKITKELASRVKKALRNNGFYYYAGGVDEYDAATKIYRDARRFRKKVYSEDIETLT
ncbi:tail completion protein gp17 [Planococcus sp. SE5232]|uniref:tail completion protein gp17 n=1 Tax=unclassified Planococcus (in: firmicutes) TaxID=2662419 RepID=UPI003D6A4BC4